MYKCTEQVLLVVPRSHTPQTRLLRGHDRRTVNGHVKRVFMRAKSYPTLWAAAQTALTQLALTQLGNSVGPGAIRTPAIDATSGTVLAVDRDGSPVSAALMRNDPIDDESTCKIG